MTGGGDTRPRRAAPAVRPRVPVSNRTGIGWPALPEGRNALLLALQHQFEQTQWWPPETLRAAQLEQLKLLVAHAVRTVPFYGDRLGPAARGDGRAPTLEQWRKVPLLRREDIRAAGPALLSRELPKDHEPTADASTSGSTGAPVTVKTTAVTTTFSLAMNLRYHLWHGRDFAAAIAGIRTLSAALSDAAKTAGRIQWVPAYPAGEADAIDIERPVGEQLEWLVRRDPDYLLTFPTNLAALLRRSEETGTAPSKLRQVMTMGEALDPALRERCARVWGATLTDAYSANEVGFIALQCPKRPHYHVLSESVLVEVLRDDGTPCRPGEQGAVVVTSLHNFATPIIRYVIGDYAVVGEPCSCGRGLPVIDRILGRVRNMVTLPSGEQRFPRFRPLGLRELDFLRQYQFVQRTLEEIDLNLVAERWLTGDEARGLIARIREAFGHPFTVNLVYVDEIPRMASGKFEDFVSLVAD